MKLYALCDADTLKKKGKSLQDFVSSATKHQAEIIQYRNKNGDLPDIKQTLIELRELWDGYLIINDHIELVPFCDGLHVGQEDLKRFGPTNREAVLKIRQEIGDEKMLGISTHNEAEVKEANALPLDYIGLGAYKSTATKDVEHILGERLDSIAAHSTHPVGAIGGVKLTDCFEYVTYLVIGSDLYED